jgi:pyruvate/2-oxoglutarate dehydrogenase complex dihydrolipoamide dehydrogenase (E3) component
MNEATEKFDAIVIGSGQGGNPLAGALAAAGKKTALVERQDVGGTCINRGCTPTKTMVASARVAYLARRGADYGVETGNIAIDLGRVRERKRAIVKSFREGGENRLAKANVELIRGEASFSGALQVRVALNGGGERRLTAAQIFLNTGTRSTTPKIEGIDTVPHLDNASIMELDRVPEHLLVLGGGYIGLEFSQMFRRFGSKVTIIQSGPQLLMEEDPDVAAEVLKILREDGIEVLLNAHTEKVAKSNHGIRLQLAAGSPASTVEGSDLLVAAGRRHRVGRESFCEDQRPVGDFGPRSLCDW